MRLDSKNAYGPEIRVQFSPKRKTVKLRDKNQSAETNAEHKRSHFIPPLSLCDHNCDCKAVKPDPCFEQKAEIFVQMDLLVNQAALNQFYKLISIFDCKPGS